MTAYNIIILFSFSIFIYICLLIQIAYSTLAERKVMAAIQRRVGPNVLGLNGLGQPLADGVKLLVKETILPAKADKLLFLFSPILSFLLSMPCWNIMPVSYIGSPSNLNVGVLFIFMISSLSVYGVVLAGWASNSKYAFMGSLRSIAQMISYEIIIGFAIIPIFILTGSANLYDIVSTQDDYWNIFCVLPGSVIFFICTLAETNRAPFDLPEAEAELVAGFNVEYSSLIFALFFLGEYANILLLSGLFVVLFLGGWWAPFNPFNLLIPNIAIFYIKLIAVFFIFIWVRASLPRFRYDQLMRFCWVELLFIIITLILIFSIVASIFVYSIYDFASIFNYSIPLPINKIFFLYFFI